jgi:SAM-dependent methyltransferase
MSRAIAQVFDAMAGAYDELEPWYEHLYRALHAILETSLAPPPGASGRRALDAGCGTGFQTTLLARLGYETHGIDLSPGLLAVARDRLAQTSLVLGSIEALPYRDRQFDAVSCCGSTLSLVDDPARAIAELARVLRPGGLLLAEVEHRWSLDLGWSLLSSLAGDALGYGTSPAQAWCHLTRAPRSGCDLEYPLPLGGGGMAFVRLHLFTLAELRGMLRRAGLRPRRVWGIHAITNLIPSTTLHRERLGRGLALLYRHLCAIDQALGRIPAAARLASSVVVLAERSPAACPAFPVRGVGIRCGRTPGDP